MANKRGQGLPLELIVLAAIAAIVLVLIIAFTIGGGSVFFKKIFEGGTQAVGDDLATARNSCESLCSQAKLTTTTTAFKSSSYCAKILSLDLDGDGNLGGCPQTAGGFGFTEEECTGGDDNIKGEMETGLTCFSSTLDVKCSATVGGQAVSQADCA